MLIHCLAIKLYAYLFLSLDDTAVVQEDSAQLNRAVDIPKINSHLGKFSSNLSNQDIPWNAHIIIPFN